MAHAIQVSERERLAHSPTLNTVLMVEDSLKGGDLLTLAELKKKLPKQVMHQTLLQILDYLQLSGKIVIGSNSIAIRDLIKDKENGYLFEFNNPKDLARVIELALSQDSRMLKKNTEKSVQEFNWEKVIGKIDDVIFS